MVGASAGRASDAPDEERLLFRANRATARPTTAITIVRMVLVSMIHPPVMAPDGALGIFLPLYPVSGAIATVSRAAHRRPMRGVASVKPTSSLSPIERLMAVPRATQLTGSGET